MDFTLFKDPKLNFIVTVFVDKDSFERRKRELENLSNQKNVRLVVQLCPYEGIEFLYRIVDTLNGHYHSIDKELFWEAIEIKSDTTKEIRDNMAEAHHLILCGLLEQDEEKVKLFVKRLNEFSLYFEKPLGKVGTIA